MEKTQVMNRASRVLHNVGFQLKKHSPEILVAVGVVGTVASAVMACKATLKVNDILDETKENVAKIHDCMADEGLQESGKYTEEDGKKDLTIVYAQTGVKLVKLYGPSIALGALSLGCILTSNNILRKRNVALAAAYATVDKSFKEYRSRVVDRFGEEVDRQLKYNIKAKEIEEVVVDENGEEKNVKKNVNVVDDVLSQYSEFAKVFDELNEYYERDSEYNLMFLRSRQRYANDLLKSRGRLFLNDVYDMLGFERTRAGQIVGWVYDPENPDIDNYIDFGIYDIYKKSSREFVNGYEPAIILDFNVDGNVWESM